MAASGVVITLAAGTLTFGNEWYQTNKPDWKIPVATLLLAALIDAVNSVDSTAATGLGIIIFIGATATKFKGKSVANTLTSIAKGKTT